MKRRLEKGDKAYFAHAALADRLLDNLLVPAVAT
jgi:hypothetical protein